MSSVVPATGPDDEPLSARACLEGVEISEPLVSPDGRWIAVVLNGDDGAFLYRLDPSSLLADTADSRPVYAADLYRDEAWSPWPVRAGRSLGGGCFTWLADSSGVVVMARTGEVWSLPLDGVAQCWLRPADLPADVDGQPVTVACPVVDASGTRLAVTVDQAAVWIVDLVTRAVTRGDDGAWDFVTDPVWWKDGLVWTAWSVPAMPWDHSVAIGQDQHVFAPSSCQVQQVRVTTDGTRIGWLDDSSGWLNVRIADGPRITEQFEHGGPSWSERQRSWCFDVTGNRVAFTRNEEGFGRLCCVDLEDGRVTERARAVHGQLSWAGDRLVALRTGARTPTRVVVYDTSTDDWQRHDLLIGPAESWNEHRSLVEPSLVRTSSTDGQELFARLYRSPVPHRGLLCWIHGGPTDQWPVTFLPRLSYWLDRGYSIVVPDHRGSTGHGRAYTQALRGRWGDLDVDDVHRLLDHVRDSGGYEASEVAIMGSSAGGMTALALAARYPGVAAAVVVAYPVSDIAALDGGTHRFEAHYNRTLLGSPEETARLSGQRSPIHLVDALARTPVLVFHGGEDPVVPIAQSDRLVSELRVRRQTVEYVVFADEGHGFRRLSNKMHEYERTEQFLMRYLSRRS